MTKAEARAEFKRRRLALSRAEREHLEGAALALFKARPWPPVTCVHAYLPIASQHEFDPGPFVQWLEHRNPGLRVVHPQVVGLHDMEHLEARTGNRIPPEKIDLVLTPLIVFDERGIRIGYGKGYYDRFLSQCRPDVIKVGLSYFDAAPLLEDPGEFDVPLSIGVSPSKLYAFV